MKQKNPERFKQFLAENPEAAQRIDRWEKKGLPTKDDDARGLKHDRVEDRRDRREDRRDKREDLIDAKHDGGWRDKAEDVRDRKEDVRDRAEDRRDNGVRDHGKGAGRGKGQGGERRADAGGKKR